MWSQPLCTCPPPSAQLTVPSNFITALNIHVLPGQLIFSLQPNKNEVKLKFEAMC